MYPGLSGAHEHSIGALNNARVFEVRFLARFEREPARTVLSCMGPIFRFQPSAFTVACYGRLDFGCGCAAAWMTTSQVANRTLQKHAISLWGIYARPIGKSCCSYVRETAGPRNATGPPDDRGRLVSLALGRGWDLAIRSGTTQGICSAKCPSASRTILSLKSFKYVKKVGQLCVGSGVCSP